MHAEPVVLDADTGTSLRQHQLAEITEHHIYLELAAR